MDKVFKFIVNIGLGGFLIFTVPMVILYFGLLWDKAVRPHYKNMNSKEVIEFGLLAIVFTILDFLIIKRFIGLIKKSKN